MILIADATPITRPVLSKTGPPEFPGLIGALINPSKLAGADDAIPVVKIPGCPSGLPITPTHHPCSGAGPIHFRPGISSEVTIPAKSPGWFQLVT